jgi:hypothetical protein
MVLGNMSGIMVITIKDIMKMGKEMEKDSCISKIRINSMMDFGIMVHQD